MNFPIFKNSTWNFTNEEMVDYLLMFRHQSVKITRTSATFLSHHSFSDGLKICLKWEIKEDVKQPHTFYDLLDLKKKNIVSYLGFSYISFSRDLDVEVDEHTYSRFLEKFGSKERTLSDMHYNALEYSCTPLTIPDSLFEDLMYRITQEIQFEKYYQDVYLKNKKEINNM